MKCLFVAITSPRVKWLPFASPSSIPPCTFHLFLLFFCLLTCSSPHTKWMKQNCLLQELLSEEMSEDPRCQLDSAQIFIRISSTLPTCRRDPSFLPEIKVCANEGESAQHTPPFLASYRTVETNLDLSKQFIGRGLKHLNVPLIF